MKVGSDGKKRKKGGSTTSGGIAFRPPQKLFNAEEVKKAYKHSDVIRSTKGGYTFHGDLFKEGYIEKDLKISALEVVDVNPRIDEIAKFLGDPSESDPSRTLDLSQIAELSRKAGITVLQPGDHIEVFEGDQKGIQGTVSSIENEVAKIKPDPLAHPELKGTEIEIPANSLRKSFKPGDHVKVMAGQNMDETGLVIRVREDVVTFLSDLSCKEVEAFARDLRVAAEVGSSANTFGQFELYDLVQLEFVLSSYSNPLDCFQKKKKKRLVELTYLYSYTQSSNNWSHFQNRAQYLQSHRPERQRSQCQAKSNQRQEGFEICDRHRC
jgi:transcription elongation factor SPT5